MTTEDRRGGWLLPAALLLVAPPLGVVAAVRRGWHFPDRVEPVAVVSDPTAPLLPRGAPVRALVWNIQYCGSRRHHFFYDGGRQVHVPPGDMAATLAEVARVIRAADPDLVLLQEVDRGSDRTGRVDEHAELLRQTGYPCHASAPYHRAAWVPHPTHQPMGRVDMHLSVFSRHPIASAQRVQLALLQEPWWRRMFNLKRAVLEVRLPVEGGGELAVLNTHLSAFSHGDGTLQRQVATLLGRATGERLFLLAGDMNALPPGDDARRLGEAAVEYPEATSPVAPLFRRLRAFSPAAPDPAWRSYLPFGATEPDRQIDYVFCGQEVQPGAAQVLQERSISDHLPILVTFIIR
jgi:endonuclease/exonuclease/phosphatase family metal-dependent hydrolase